MPSRASLFFFVLLLLFAAVDSPAQIVFRELPADEITDVSLDYLQTSSVRQKILLNGEWEVYSVDDEEKNKIPVIVPSVFEGDAEIVFEKALSFSDAFIQANAFELHFLGLSYFAEISINNSLIHRHPGGEFPTSLLLPNDLLHADAENILSIKITPPAETENTLPLKKRFLYPEQFGGIFRDVYINVIPRLNIADFDFTYTIQPQNSSLTLMANALIANTDFASEAGADTAGAVFLSYTIVDNATGETAAELRKQISVQAGREEFDTSELTVNNPKLWSADDVKTYTVVVRIYRGDVLVDEIKLPAAFYEIASHDDLFSLNDVPFQLNGVTYIPSNEEYGPMLTYGEMTKAVQTIKTLGFNAIRFTRGVPHPFMLSECTRQGLLAFIEIPLDRVPEGISDDDLFIENCRNYTELFYRAFKNCSAVAAIGIGHGYIGNVPEHRKLLAGLAEKVKDLSGRLTYASFINEAIDPVENLDMYGIELLNRPLAAVEEEFTILQERFGGGRVFIAEAGYIANMGHSSGYTNPHSIEAQAKFFEELLSYSEDKSYAGYFINTMFDYRSNYHSIISGYDEERTINLGILGEDRGVNRLSYKVIYSKLHNQERVTIPLGVQTDDAPMAFILYGLALALFLGFLVNSGRKFREDTTRALLRPYNFFADIRDLRIISGVQTTVLGIIISGVMALVFSSLLFSLKFNILFEKILVSFGSDTLLNTMSYLTWHPVESMMWLTGVFFISIILIALIVKLASYFVMNKVLLSNAYFTVIWSYLPLVLLIPLAIILYRVLGAEAVTLYMYIIILLFVLWVLYRLIKGVYVIFDVSPGAVYFYAILLFLLIVGGILFYQQAMHSTVDFIVHTLKEFQVKF